MNRRRSLFSFLVAAFLYFPVSTSNTVPQSAPIITAERLKLIAGTALRISPTPATLPASVAVPLGLSPSERVITKQLGETTAEGQHIFAAPIIPISKYVVILSKSDGKIYTYACDLNGKLLSAGIFSNKQFAPLSLADATPGFETELRYWRDARLPD
jgi:hypothetical protein